MNKIDFAAFMEEFLEDRANAHIKAYADHLASTGDLKGARRVDHDELVTATQGLKAKKAAQTPFFSSPRMAAHVDTSDIPVVSDKTVKKRGFATPEGKPTAKGRYYTRQSLARLDKR